ncbi:MAG: Stk1 family PASTA domain-containing Ser/Thr kinase [Bacilli bacterium]|nr:Stk1 family PASTA domain-containing Ser/Thr kinase [Bacilli bacterium]
MITKGQKINDRYEIIKSIGEGGMANVYLGHDTILDRNVAIKILRGDLANDEKFVRRFQREALSASSLAHPNIVEMYDVGEDDGTYYIIMEYVEGKTLKQLLKKRGTLTLSEAIDIMSQLTDGMAHAHDSYIIHRDLKPQNIMIKDDGQIKITDFGIAMALNSTQLTQTNSVMGSVHYLPPEQASGKGCTIKSDIYSMGIIFYELLSGSLPFKGDNAVEIALKHMREPLPSLRENNSSIPQSIENIIKKATAKNPKNRYDSARSMHEDLLTALNDERMDEAPYEYKYPENDGDSKKTKKSDKELDKEEDAKLASIGEDTTKTEITDDFDALEDKKSNRLIIILAVIFGLVLITLVMFLLAWSGAIPFLHKNKTSVTIPNCENLKVSSCEKKLEKLGFVVKSKVELVPSDTVDKNRVVKTEPAAGRSVKKGSKVTIYKSSGEETIALEDYTDKNAIEVKTLLETKYELKVSIEKKEPTDEQKKKEENTVIGQSLEAGTRVKKGDQLILYVPDIVDEFPDMAAEGWSLSDVEAFCTEYGLILQQKAEYTNAYADGAIIAQNRTVGSKIVKGTTLTVTVAHKPVATQPKEEEKEEENDEEPKTE